MDWMSPSWLARERSWGKEGDEGKERPWEYGVEKWESEEGVDRRKEEGDEKKKGRRKREKESTSIDSRMSVINGKRGVSSDSTVPLVQEPSC